MKALSIRQPWAWLIVHGHKDIENRSWRTHFRGPVLIHASKGMTRDEYAIGHVLAEENGVTLPPFEDLPRGGIVGQAEITGCVDRSPSPWFFGPVGFIMEMARPRTFRPCKGALGFFEVERGAVS
ncbi:ASCH domain-containing protein [Luteolibacter marinus]|uniref:ASCH domain-containing protein n=1 Tax=Luteolibacter marinus TaxID=2776705 RepID=UPI00186849DA